MSLFTVFALGVLINVALLVLVLNLGKRWPVLPAIAGAVGFLLCFLDYQRLSGGLYEFAAAFDRSLTVRKVNSLVFMVVWLVIAVRSAMKVLKGKSGEEIVQAASRAVQSLKSPGMVDQEVLTNTSVLSMADSGISDDIIQSKIRLSRCSFSLSTNDLKILKEKGVSDCIISMMMEAQAKRGVTSTSASV